MRYTLSNFRCDRAVSKGTLLVAEFTRSSVSQLPLKGFSWTFVPRTSHACATRSIRLVGIGQEIRALYMRNKVSFLLYLDFHWWGGCWILIPHTFHACATSDVSLVRSVSNEGQFTWSTMYLFACNSVYVWGIFRENSYLAHSRNAILTL